MKLVRFGQTGAESPGILDSQGRVRDLSGKVADFQGEDISLEAIAAIRAIDVESLPLAPEGARLGAPLADTPNFHCVGLNYARHAAESGMEAPREPVLFSKATSALSGPFDQVIQPKGSTKLDWEVELGIVIGKRVSHISEEDALSCVAGYCTINDVSERAFQLESTGQWVKGKSAPTFGPLGPWLVTADEVPDPQTLALSLSVNGETQQDSNTADMIFSVREIISYMSRYMELRPGDVIATGTPEGVGMGQNPQKWLHPGDVIELEIEGLGKQRQEVVAFS